MEMNEELTQTPGSPWMFSEVVENVHLLNIAQAGGHPFDYFAKLAGIEAELIDEGRYVIIGHTDTGVTVRLDYDLSEPV